MGMLRSMSTLYLIRHPMCRMDPTRPPAEWELSSDGRRQLDRLLAAPWWLAVEHVYSSAEPKTVVVGEAAAARYGTAHSAHRELDEVHRSAFVPDYGRVVRQALANPDEPANGWEALTHARDRAVGFLRTKVANGPLPAVVVSHGLVLGEVRASLQGQAHVAYEDWRALPFAAVALVDPEAWKLVADFA